MLVRGGHIFGATYAATHGTKRTDAIMFAVDPFTILVWIFVSLFLIKMFKGSKGNSYKNFPPGPKPLPIIGNMHILNLKRPYQTFIELSKKYGPVFSVQIGSEKIVILCGYETVKDALVNYAEEFSERPHVPIFQDITNGYGVIFAHGENWKVMRRFTISTLRDLGMGRKTIENQITEECDFLVKKFKSYGGKPFENTMIMNAAVANIIVSILLGHRFDYEDPVILRLMSYINENIRLAGTPMVLLYNTFTSLIRWLPGGHRKVNQNAVETKKFITATFTKHKEQLDVNDQRTLIDTFLVKQQEEKSEFASYFHNENLVMLVGNLFAAGMETTSTTLRWGLLLMMKYPEIQKNVQTEIEKVIGSSEPQSEHRKLMPYTDAVIHEVQRFSNIIPTNLPHATAQDVTFKGYFIPKGTYVMPLLTSVLRDEAHFEKPNEFYPGHFLDSKGNFMKKEAFLPFSAGKRSCAGENLAKMELFLFFTRLLQNFTFQAPPGAELDLTPALGFTTPPMTYLIRAIPRS
ncbi:cytochrome P450 2K1-like isoform X1 [Phyllobates terribilis]|uniref:cytochrome P450 2K1-like isoform X1 n=2 Tax=Phyllobates terribilis TaxID=111132 RepID=UPI003CCAF9C5